MSDEIPSLRDWSDDVRRDLQATKERPELLLLATRIHTITQWGVRVHGSARILETFATEDDAEEWARRLRDVLQLSAHVVHRSCLVVRDSAGPWEAS